MAIPARRANHPVWALLGTEDEAIAPATERFMAERANATIDELPASHASIASHPEAATQVVLQADEATVGRADASRPK